MVKATGANTRKQSIHSKDDVGWGENFTSNSRSCYLLVKCITLKSTSLSISETVVEPFLAMLLHIKTNFC